MKKYFFVSIVLLCSISVALAKEAQEEAFQNEEPTIFEEFKNSLIKATRNDEFLIPAKSEIYEQITQLCAEQKRTATITNKPLPIRELKSYLYALDYDKLTDSSKKIYDSIMEEFNRKYSGFDTGGVAFAVSAIANPEFYLRTNNEINWAYDFSQKKHFLDIPICVSFSKYVASEAIPFMGLNNFTANSKYNFMNFPLAFNEDSFTVSELPLFRGNEWKQPKIAYVSTGFQFGDSPSGVQLSFGRSPVSYGNSALQSIVMSEEFVTDWFGTIQFYSPAFKYNVSAMQVKTQTYFYSHQLQFRPFRNFQFGACEGVFITAPFELRYFNPAFVFHQFSYWNAYAGNDYDNVCGYFGLTAEFVPVKNLRFYGAFAQTEMQQIAELEDDEARCTPNAFGFQVGADYTIPVSLFGGSFWKVTLEYLYTSPWLYLRQRETSSLLNHFGDGLGYSTTWIGSPEGLDSMIGFFSVKYEVPQKWNASFSYKFSAHGDNYYDAYNKYPGVENGRTVEERLKLSLATTPSGDNPVYTNVFTLAGGYKWNSRITTNAQTSAIYVVNNVVNKSGQRNNAFGVEVVVSAEFRLF